MGDSEGVRHLRAVSGCTDVGGPLPALAQGPRLWLHTLCRQVTESRLQGTVYSKAHGIGHPIGSSNTKLSSSLSPPQAGA